MHCREARRRLTDPAFADDQKLQDHLRSCPACARQARAALQLHQTLLEAAASDNTETIPWFEQIARVESRVTLNKRKKTKETTIMNKIASKLRTPRYSISLGVAVLVLLICTLVPFKIHQTIGYEVAFAGVDRNLALDTDRLSKLLIALGVDDASFDVGDCEATCKVKISELKTDKEVQLVLAAFGEMGNCTVEDISEIHGDKPTTLLKEVRTIVVDSDNAEFGENDKVRQIVLQCLGELDSSQTGAYTVWVSDEDGNISYNVEVEDTDDTDDIDGSFIFIGDSTGTRGDSGITMKTNIEVTQNNDGTLIANISLSDGRIETIDLNDPNAVDRLKELGLDMLVGDLDNLADTSGVIHKMVICSQEVVVDDDSGDSIAKQDVDGNLPKGFELAQNYPNPFNPNTTIDYTVPSAEHVSLQVYNVNGQLVKTLVDKVVGAGQYSVEWDATSDRGSRVASGMYFYRLTVGDAIQTKKMTLLK